MSTFADFMNYNWVSTKVPFRAKIMMIGNSYLITLARKQNFNETQLYHGSSNHPPKHRSTETFPMDKKMFENQWKRHELVGTREFIDYPSVQGISVDSQTLFLVRKVPANLCFKAWYSQWEMKYKTVIIIVAFLFL